MKEMILPLTSWALIIVSEDAIRRLPKEFQTRNQFGEVYLHRCMDAEVISVAKEMKEDFIGGGYSDGFRIITWDETKVEPIFFIEPLDDTTLYFIPRKSEYNEDEKYYKEVHIDEGIKGFHNMQKYLDRYETYYDKDEYVTMTVHDQ